MKRFFHRLFSPIYNGLGTAGFLLLALSFFTGQQTFDIHLHDTYFVLSISIIMVLTGCFFVLLWSVYALIRKRRYSPVLMQFHVVVSIAFVLFVSIALYLPLRRTYLDYSSFRHQSKTLEVAILLFILAQLLFFVNVFIALIRRRN